MKNLTISLANLDQARELDQFLADREDAFPYHHIAWLHAIKDAYGHDYLYLVARLDDRIVGILPLCIFQGYSGKRSLCSLPFCDLGGVLADDDRIHDALLKFALEKMAGQQISRMELRQPSRSNCHPEEELIDRKVSMLLKLPPTADELFKSFKSKLRSQVKKAEKNGLTFDATSDVKSISDFYQVFSTNMHVLGSPTHSLNWFEILLKYYGDQLVVGRVWKDDVVVGAGIILISGYRVSIPWASTLREYNRLAPNMLLYWNLLRISIERGGGVFDFGRSTYQEGTFNFKQQWGAQPVLLDWKQLDQNGEVFTQGTASTSKLRSVIETVWKKMPLAFANLIGPYLRKRISL